MPLRCGPIPSVKRVQVPFDCAEPERIARFWCEVLAYLVPPPPEGFSTWDDFNGSLPPGNQDLWFACVGPQVSVRGCTLDVRVGAGLEG